MMDETWKFDAIYGIHNHTLTDKLADRPIVCLLVSEERKLVSDMKLNMVVKLEFRSPSIDNEGKIQFTMLKLKTNGDLKVMWSTFYRYSIKGSIEMDATIQRSDKDIIKMLQRPEPSL